MAIPSGLRIRNPDYVHVARVTPPPYDAPRGLRRRMPGHKGDAREEFQTVLGTASLGLIADNGLIAASRYAKQGALLDRDRDALRRCLVLIQDALALGERRSPGTQTVRRVSQRGAAGRARVFEAVTAAVAADGKKTSLPELVDSIEAMLKKGGDADAATKVAEFCRRLSVFALSRSQEYARPIRSKRSEWARRASRF